MNGTAAQTHLDDLNVARMQVHLTTCQSPNKRAVGGEGNGLLIEIKGGGCRKRQAIERLKQARKEMRFKIR